ncbi:proline rich and Gla domain 2 [Phyllostomus discolor]|uniref:Proline rich and Gla domain 2 n=1 Tax=Phyllostomus discolor TaxID=89673 RepID=A0A833YRC0_9CHIR|nr:proline rich and Gla domain 2 [Phyllostomus discolor]
MRGRGHPSLLLLYLGLATCLDTSSSGEQGQGRGRVDIAGLVVGLASGILLIVLAGLGAFWYLHWHRGQGQQPSPQEAELINPLSPLSSQGPPTPLPLPKPPGLPTYEQALAASGVHDAPPPPYSSLRRPC